MVRTNFLFKLLVALDNFCHINLMKFSECKVLPLDCANLDMSTDWEKWLGVALSEELKKKEELN